ncbi:Protein-lysine N-methyltransferase EFM6 [Hypsizygus marmoreus]|uniref:Protein-lysine N-methyltransferase EFM6 n=1 Tax=Hypsizygus marmoreus TaxID=39966 RepID=A0A369JN25_HYPMA|nr:Protein-lysine N-methyltransferase EFM6 [Hypsizygus marmoreus]
MSKSQPLNTLARDEELDTLDPLRHLMQQSSPSSSPSSSSSSSDLNLNTQDPSPSNRKAFLSLLPNQSRSIHDETLHLTFPSPSQALPISISLAVDASPGCGGIAWPAGQVLSSYLVKKGPSFLSNKTVLELGSGTGLVGLVAAKLGANPLLGIMRANVLANSLQASVHVAELNWGTPLPPTLPPTPDIILAADCVYFEPAFPLLVQTLADLVAVREDTEVLFCYKKRRKADKRFFVLLKKKFTWTEVTDDPDREVYAREAISLLRLIKRKPLAASSNHMEEAGRRTTV